MGGVTSIRPTLASTSRPSPSPSTKSSPRRAAASTSAGGTGTRPTRAETISTPCSEAASVPRRFSQNPCGISGAPIESASATPSGSTRASPSSPCATRCAAASTPLISSSLTETSATAPAELTTSRSRSITSRVCSTERASGGPASRTKGSRWMASARRRNGESTTQGGQQRPENAPLQTSTGSATCAPTPKTRL